MTKIESISLKDLEHISDMITNAVNARVAHIGQSPKTEREFATVNDNISLIKTNCNNHNTNNEIMRRDIDTIKEYIKEDLQWKKDFEAKMDNAFQKKANRWVEKVIVSIITIFALAALWIIFDRAGLPH